MPEALLPNLLKVDYTYLPTDRFSRLSHENQVISAVANKVGAAFVDPISLMCVSGKCLAVVDKGPPIKLSMWDQDHLTAEGSVYLAKRISSVLKESDRQVQVQTRAEAR